MYSIDSVINNLHDSLSNDDKETLKGAFQVIWEVGGGDYTDWAQCKNLQNLIGISVEM